VAVYDVTSYGAVGDGVTDDLTAIQNAINAAQTAGGGIVFFPAAKTYLVSGAPTVTGSGIIVRGEGDASVIKLAPASMTANGHTIGVYVNGGSNITIEDLCVDGNFANIAKDGGTVVPSTFSGALGAAVSTAPAAGTTETWTVNAAASTASAAYSSPFAVKVDSEYVLVTGGYGTTSWTVKRGFGQGGGAGGGATATHSNGAGIGSTNGTLFDATITAYGSGTPKTYMSSSYSGGVDASTYLAWRMPVAVKNAENVTVRNCLLKNSASGGAVVSATSVNGTKDVLVTGCRIQYTWDNAVYFHQGNQYCTAEANFVSDVMYNGVSAVYSDHIAIIGNNIRQAGPSFSDSGGIQINGSSNSLADGNLIDACQFYGVQVSANSETNITGGLGGSEVYSWNTNITNNQVTGGHAPDYPSHNVPGINVFGASETSIVGNIVNDCDYGISLGSKVTDTFVGSNRITRVTSLGINVGNSADVVNTVVRNNFVGWCGSHGLFANAPVYALDNAFVGNTGMGVSLGTPPAGIPRKVDYVVSNLILDNTDSGVLVGGGSTALAVVERNTFSNAPGVLFRDGSATNASTTFTSATAAFTSADTGRVLIIFDQGTGGTSTVTTISSVTNATTVVLAAAAAATETGLTFLVGRGPQYFADGSTTTAANSVLTSATASFTSNDVNELVVLLSLDPVPAVLGVAKVNSYTSATQVALNADVGTLASCGFWINRSQGQSGKAINNFNGNPVIDRDNTVYGIPEYQGTGGVVNRVQRAVTELTRRPVADHDYTVLNADQLVAVTSITAPRTITLPAGLGAAGLPYYVDIKDESGGVTANNVTLSVTGGGTIDGASSLVMGANYQHHRVYSTGTNWFTVGARPDPSTGLSAAEAGLVAWAFDPSVAQGSGSALTAAQVNLIRVQIRTVATVTNILAHLTGAGAGLTTGQNFAGLYNSAGTLLSATADQTTTWGSTGFKTMALSAQQVNLAPGKYYIALLANGTTPPSLARGNNLNGSFINAAVTGANARWASNGTGTSLPASLTLSSNSVTGTAFWAALD
jgi:hypothetical protein